MSKKKRFDFGSWSTFGQTALLIFAALLIVQVFVFFLLLNITDQWRQYVVVEPAVSRFADVAQQVAAAPKSARDQIVQASNGADQSFALTPEVRFFHLPAQSKLEENLKTALKTHNVRFLAVSAFLRGHFPGGMPPPPGPMLYQGRERPPQFALPPGSDMAAGSKEIPPPPFAPENKRFRVVMIRSGGLYGPPPGHTNEEVNLAAQLPDGTWLNGRFVMFRPLPLLFSPLVISQIALFVALLAVSLFWASRISRPLRILASAAENLRPQDALNPIPEKGPRDVRAAITSFNTMAQRVRDLLQEKDRMLSAIGHDLRTPLASLRIRAESIEPESERERVVETLDEMTKMVDEILSLARLGHSTEPYQMVDLPALADSLVEEFRELGKDVTFEEAPRAPLKMQPALVRRLLRNLIDNAVKYGERARVSIVETSDAIQLRVEDDGPGIPQQALTDVLQPFTRLEHSRSRETGGIGLGLSIADAIARSQGATLILENRASEGQSPGGLRAIVRWPRENASL